MLAWPTLQAASCGCRLPKPTIARSARGSRFIMPWNPPTCSSGPCERSGTARKGRETEGKAVITAFKREDRCLTGSPPSWSGPASAAATSLSTAQFASTPSVLTTTSSVPAPRPPPAVPAPSSCAALSSSPTRPTLPITARKPCASDRPTDQHAHTSRIKGVRT